MFCGASRGSRPWPPRPRCRSARADDQIARSAWGSLAIGRSSPSTAPPPASPCSRSGLPERAGDVAGRGRGTARGARLVAAVRRAKHVPGIVDLRAAIQMSRAGFSQQHLPAAHVYLARALYVIGDWDEALVHARAAQAIVTDDRLSWIRGRAESVLGVIAAARGSWNEAEGMPGRRERRWRASQAGAAWPELVARLVDSAHLPGQGRRPRASSPRCDPWPTDQRAVDLSDGGGCLVADPDRRSHRLPVKSDDGATELDRLQRHIDDTGMDIGGQVTGLRARLAAANGDPDAAAKLLRTSPIRHDPTGRPSDRPRAAAPPLWPPSTRPRQSSRCGGPFA